MSAYVNSGLVTIGIPTYNRSGCLVKAVRSALAQTYSHIEVVVSDNASTDDTLLRMREIDDPRVTLLKQPKNLGMIGNFNACLNAARGTLFLMLSDDDLMEPDAVEQLSRPFLQEPDNGIGLTWCPSVVINPNEEALWTTDGGPAIESPASLVMGILNGSRGPRFSSVMLRTADALAEGGYNGERYGALCDTANWALAALRHESVACIQRPLVKNMVHAASSTSGQACRDWRAWGETVYADLVEPLRKHGNSERELRAAKRNFLANLTVTILLPNVGQPGWFPYLFREILLGWRNFLTLGVARRVFRESWKFVRFWPRERRA
jgi:glycosyltransferase involved in cell wall biosynthesis